MAHFIVRKSEVAELTRLLTKKWTAESFDPKIAEDLKSLNEKYDQYEAMRKNNIVRRIVNLLTVTGGVQSWDSTYKAALSLLTTAEDSLSPGITTVSLRQLMKDLRHKHGLGSAADAMKTIQEEAKDYAKPEEK